MHIVAGFLARRLAVDLQRRLDERCCTVSWPDLMRGLAEVRSVDLELDGERYRLGTDLTGSAFDAFAGTNVQPPSLVTHLGRSPDPPPSPTRPSSKCSAKIPIATCKSAISRNFANQTVEFQWGWISLPRRGVLALRGRPLEAQNLPLLPRSWGVLGAY